MNWSVRPDKRFRLALGSFVEEYNNKVRSVFSLAASFRLMLTSLRTEAQNITSDCAIAFNNEFIGDVLSSCRVL